MCKKAKSKNYFLSQQRILLFSHLLSSSITFLRRLPSFVSSCQVTFHQFPDASSLPLCPQPYFILHFTALDNNDHISINNNFFFYDTLLHPLTIQYGSQLIQTFSGLLNQAILHVILSVVELHRPSLVFTRTHKFNYETSFPECH